jgi:hypothetical protein
LVPALHFDTVVNGVLYPAFLPGTEVVQFIVTDRFDQAFGPVQLVRVSGSPDSARFGSWWPTRRQVEGPDKRFKSADEIRAELALTQTPACIAFAKSVRTGVRGYMGVVAPAFDEPGGAVEF